MRIDDTDVIERIWYGDDVLAAVLRAALLPLEGAFRAAVTARGALYDSGLLRAESPELPCLSVGNLTVGGTGKTPVAAWFASRLAAAGARPAIILRGYGHDEARVHRLLNGDAPVIVNSSRAAGARVAKAAGADIAVLDDAFQHRRVRRAADVVLLSADRWSGSAHLLPAGPWREPPRAARRATLLAITRKTASVTDAEALERFIARTAPAVPIARLRLALGGLIGVDSGEQRPLSVLRGKSVRAILAIADPHAFVGQITAVGARVSADIFSDHHCLSDAEIRNAADRAGGSDFVLCTLKDAVKLMGRWPREAPALWYVSQHVIVERGADAVERMVEDVVLARDRLNPTAG